MGQRAVIYCRVSTADQSCVRQKDELKRFAECADYEVSGVFIETESGGLCCKVGAPVGNRVWFWLGAVVMNDFKRRHFRVDKYGDTIDVYLPPPRNAKAAKHFLGKAVNGLKDWERPETINTDKAPTYGIAISEFKKDGKLPDMVQLRQVKYLNNVIEVDHGKLKQMIRLSRSVGRLPSMIACDLDKKINTIAGNYPVR